LFLWLQQAGCHASPGRHRGRGPGQYRGARPTAGAVDASNTAADTSTACRCGRRHRGWHVDAV